MGAIDLTTWVPAPRGNRTETDLIMAIPGTPGSFSLADSANGTGAAGTTVMTAQVERIGLRLNDDPTQFVRVVNIWPAFTASANLQFQVGYQMNQNTTVTWGSAITVDPASGRAHIAGATSVADGAVRLSGRLISLRIFNDNLNAWNVGSVAIEYEMAGRY